MIRKAEKSDLGTLVNLAVLLWNHSTIDTLLHEFSEMMTKKNMQFFLKFADNVVVGFAQCSLRYDYVEGTETTPVGYLEGIFIKEGFRNKGYAKELLAACEAWAKDKGCKEFASDCAIDNIDSFHFHKAMNFIEANRIICFIKAL